MPDTSEQARVSAIMRNATGILVTLAAAIFSVIEGEFPIALLFLCGTAMFVVEGVRRRIRRTAAIVDGAERLLWNPDEVGGSRSRRPLYRGGSSTAVSAGRQNRPR